MRETLQLGNIDTNNEITLKKIKIAELVLKLRPKNTVFRHCDGNAYFYHAAVSSILEGLKQIKYGNVCFDTLSFDW